MDNFRVGEFLAGGGGEGKRRMVLYRGTLSSQWGLDDNLIFLRNLGMMHSLTMPLILARIAYKGIFWLFLIHPKEIT